MTYVPTEPYLREKEPVSYEIRHTLYFLFIPYLENSEKKFDYICIWGIFIYYNEYASYGFKYSCGHE